jgi:hypothetical protein
MSSTGFFHSRRCGTVGDAGCWAFVLGVFVIHPPNETQLQTESLFTWAWVRPLLEPTMQVSPAFAVRKADCPRYYSNKAVVVRTTPTVQGFLHHLFGQSVEPSIRYYVKLWPSNINRYRSLSRLQRLECEDRCLAIPTCSGNHDKYAHSPSTGECTFRGMDGAAAE